MSCNWNEYNLNILTSNNWRASLVALTPETVGLNEIGVLFRYGRWNKQPTHRENEQISLQLCRLVDHPKPLQVGGGETTWNERGSAGFCIENAAC